MAQTLFAKLSSDSFANGFSEKHSLVRTERSVIPIQISLTHLKCFPDAAEKKLDEAKQLVESLDSQKGNIVAEKEKKKNDTCILFGVSIFSCG